MWILILTWFYFMYHYVRTYLYCQNNNFGNWLKISVNVHVMSKIHLHCELTQGINISILIEIKSKGLTVWMMICVIINKTKDIWNFESHLAIKVMVILEQFTFVVHSCAQRLRACSTQREGTSLFSFSLQKLLAKNFNNRWPTIWKSQSYPTSSQRDRLIKRMPL